MLKLDKAGEMKLEVLKTYHFFVLEGSNKEKVVLGVGKPKTLPKNFTELSLYPEEEGSIIEKERRVIQEPGDYEIGGVIIKSIRAEDRLIYYFQEKGDLNILYLGEYSTQKLPSVLFEEVPRVDVLVIKVPEKGISSRLISIWLGELEPSTVLLFSLAKKPLLEIAKERGIEKPEFNKSVSVKKVEPDLLRFYFLVP